VAKAQKTVKGRGLNEISVVHGGTKYVIDVDAELVIDEQDIKSCYIDQAGKFAWYAVVHAAAMRRVDTLKMRVDVLRADIDVAKAKANDRLKKEMTITSVVGAKGKEKEKISVPSQSAIDAVVDAAAEVIEARSAVDAARKSLVDARYEQEVVKATKDAFVHRRDMLIQMGADVRQEQRDRS
jgi:hypothetical protein